MYNFHFKTLLILLLSLSVNQQMNAQNIDTSNFEFQQKKFERVAQAFSEKEEAVRTLFTVSQADIDSPRIFIRAFKKEAELELWAYSSKAGKYVLLKKYPICEKSGILGPKRREGDMQVPEGFYVIDRFNPESRYFLSLGINYPNESDSVLSDKEAPGGDIFIHGDCVTIGCLPMTDELIKEIYLAAVLAAAKGQEKIPVHIFPARMNDPGFVKIKETVESFVIKKFWTNLQQGYYYFEKNKQLPKVEVDSLGNYHFSAH